MVKLLLLMSLLKLKLCECEVLFVRLLTQSICKTQLCILGMYGRECETHDAKFSANHLL